MPTNFSRRGVMGAGLGLGAAACAQAAPLAGTGRPADTPAPYGAVPSARQWRWHGREQYAFVHFSINTFTDKEWGYGDESPKLFDPSDFDPDQIVAAAKAGGLNGIILTAKHHDGFCLWPTKLTEHSIRNSPYKNGHGDIVGELEAACRRGGIPFGLYLSPWDRNRADYGRPSYIEYYRAQVRELCTRYGELFEFWFDGANGGDGYYGGARETRKIDAPRYYNWPSIVALVHELQPIACTFDPLGADIRWVGNENGIAGEPCWPTMPARLHPQPDLLNHGKVDGELWWPAEADVSIRPGWFYHPDENAQVKSPETLLGLHARSVGRGTNFILNIAPDRRGRIPDHDLAILTSYGDALRRTYKTNLAKGSIASSSRSRGAEFAAERVLDGNRDSYWTTPDGVTTASLTLDLPPGRAFDRVRVGEYLPLGCRVRRYRIEAEMGGAWRPLSEGQSISEQAILHLDAPVETRRVRLSILDAAAPPAINQFALYRSVAPDPVAPLPRRDTNMIDPASWTVVAASAPNAAVLFDGSRQSVWTVPSASLPVSVTVDLGGAVRLGGFSLTPDRAERADRSPPRGYVVEVSTDGSNWTTAGQGEFSNIAYALATQRHSLSVAGAARFVRFRFDHLARQAAKLAIAEIGLTRADPNQP